MSLRLPDNRTRLPRDESKLHEWTDIKIRERHEQEVRPRSHSYVGRMLISQEVALNPIPSDPDPSEVSTQIHANFYKYKVTMVV